jgi:hypothetical protein
MSQERKARWRKEIEWLLSVTDHIVEFAPSQQLAKDGSTMEVKSQLKNYFIYLCCRQRFPTFTQYEHLLSFDQD